MRAPRHMSFQAKLLGAFFLVILLATAAGYLFINRAVNRAFLDFTGRSFTVQDQFVMGLIADYYNNMGSLDGLVGLLDRASPNVPILLLDPQRKVVFSPDKRFVGRTLRESELAGGVVLHLPSGEIWTIVPYRPFAGRNVLEQAFLRTTRTSLWLSGFTASAAALLLVLVLVRQTTNPLRQLEAASQRIARGDFSERVEVRSSDEIGRLAGAFNEMAASLKSAEEEKRRMIADVSHELRTPLAAVRSALEGLRDGLVEATPATFAALHDRVLLLTRLVADLHQLALADAGQLSIERRPSDIRAMLDGIVGTVGFQAEDAGIALDAIVEPDLPAVLLDAHRIEQVLLNLLANALRHTPTGGRIELRATRANEGEIELRLSDTGPGIATEDLSRIFDRFYQTDPSRESGGAGLGLSIARALVEAHGGKIWAENRLEGGATFVIRLPAAAS